MSGLVRGGRLSGQILIGWKHKSWDKRQSAVSVSKQPAENGHISFSVKVNRTHGFIHFVSQQITNYYLSVKPTTSQWMSEATDLVTDLVRMGYFFRRTRYCWSRRKCKAASRIGTLATGIVVTSCTTIQTLLLLNWQQRSWKGKLGALPVDVTLRPRPGCEVCSWAKNNLLVYHRNNVRPLGVLFVFMRNITV